MKTLLKTLITSTKTIKGLLIRNSAMWKVINAMSFIIPLSLNICLRIMTLGRLCNDTEIRTKYNSWIFCTDQSFVVYYVPIAWISSVSAKYFATIKNKAAFDITCQDFGCFICKVTSLPKQSHLSSSPSVPSFTIPSPSLSIGRKKNQ